MFGFNKGHIEGTGRWYMRSAGEVEQDGLPIYHSHRVSTDIFGVQVLSAQMRGSSGL